MVAGDEPVPLSVEWDESWFSTTETTTYHHGIARIAALLSEISYVPVEKNPESNEVLQTYKALGVSESDIEWHYTLDYGAPIAGNNQAAYSFAYKEIQTARGARKLVFVVLRGTPLSANEWISNINVSDSTHKDVPVHEGFYNTAASLHTALIYYLLKNKISPDESYFLITGHSRGAALANLLAATLEDEGIITGERLFVYTFAAPNVSQEDKTNDPRYNFIWNIVNAEDVVPTVPPNRNGWKWKKFGRTLVLANYWNTEQGVYLDDYLPRINNYFSRLLLRDYAPFKTGPFIHIQVARILTSLYKNVEKYYGSVFGLHDRAENIFWKIFPEQSGDGCDDDDGSGDDRGSQRDEEKKIPVLLRMVRRSIDSNIDGGFEYALRAFADMHACETYLSYLLALNEDEVYSEVGNAEIVINGSYDCAVYDDDGVRLCRILNGSVGLYSLKVPVAAMSLPNRTVIGLPGNKNFTVIVYKDSVLPTVINYSIEQYDAAGRLLFAPSNRHIYPRAGKVLRFRAGEVTVLENAIDYETLKGKEAKSLVRTYGLNQNVKFKILPELSLSTEKVFDFGFRTGNRELFATLLGELYHSGSASAYGLSLGIGHQQCLYGHIMLDIEAFSRLVWTPKDVKGSDFNLVPRWRLSLSYKPRHRVQFFMAGVFDLHIDEFNDGAFDPLIRRRTLPAAHITGKVDLYPALQFGIRF